jgi:polysaccharide export outer membrane protein
VIVAVSAVAALAEAQAERQKPAPSSPATRPTSPVAQPAAPRPAAAAATASDILTPEYRISPGDVLQVFVWKEPDLSREVRVRPDGFVTVPLLGDVFASGKTPKGLAGEFGQTLAQYITSPLVTVTLGQSSMLRFFVVGEVNRPGEYPLIGRTTVMQALALAGGFSEYAKTEEIRVLRQEGPREIAMPFNYKAISQGQSLHQNFALKPGDVIVVP